MKLPPFIFACMVAILAASCTVTPIQANHVCGSRSVMTAWLFEDFGETPTTAAITNSGNLVELLISPDRSTWTILSTTPQGRACIVENGYEWTLRPSPSDPA